MEIFPPDNGRLFIDNWSSVYNNDIVDDRLSVK